MSNRPPPKKPTLRAHKEALMKQAREIALKGECMGFEDVRQRLEREPALILKLWATARDRDEIDRLCEDAKWARRLHLTKHGEVGSDFNAAPKTGKGPGGGHRSDR